MIIFIKILIVLTFLFNSSTPNNTTVENPPKQAINSQSNITINPSSPISFNYISLRSSSSKSGNKVNFLTFGRNIYITNCTNSAIDIDKMELIKMKPDSTKLLVNRDNALTEGYLPNKLTNIDPSKVKLEYNTLKLPPNTIDALYSMVAVAKRNKIKGFIINSAYRNENTQRIIFNSNFKTFIKTSKTYNEAYEKTRKLVALPGFSEHQIGLALDIFSINGRHRTDFEGTKEQNWLCNNSYKYGFIMRYPKDKTKETNSSYEPWHFRYVGIPLSTYLHEKNVCLEEFYTKIFIGAILENDVSVFLQVKAYQQVFVDKAILPLVELEPVVKGTMLLTVKKV